MLEFFKQKQNENTPGQSAQKKPSVSLVIPFFNEESIIAESTQTLIGATEAESNNYDFEIVMINDGSNDKSAEIVETFALKYPSIRLISHHKNLGLGKALQTGFCHSKGDYVIVLDADLSYSPEHILVILNKLIETDANIVVASPYMKGGKVTNVPWMRYKLSKWANRFLSYLSGCPVKTLTGMVRGYKGAFIRSLSLQSSGADINPEIIYKEAIVDNKIEEIPAHLCWDGDHTHTRSKLKILSHTAKIILVGFLIKPFLFFIFPGIVVSIFAFYTILWMLIHFFREYAQTHGPSFMNNLTDAFRLAYNGHSHTFIIAFLSTMLGVQLISTGLQSLQSKYYFEELFSLQTKACRCQKKKDS